MTSDMIPQVTRLPVRILRQRVRRTLFAGLAMVSFGLAVWMIVAGVEVIDGAAGVAGLFIAIAGLAVSLAQLIPPPPPPPSAGDLADNLAVTVREQWTEEVTARSLRNPRVIPLAWSATERPVTDTADAIAGTVGARILRLSFNGRLDGRFDESVRRLADGYRHVPSGRLVLLGEPGAGKTVLAIMLALGLLDGAARPAGGTVPVVLAMSTWDPVGESLDDWIVDTLAMSYYNGRPEIPRRLLDQNLLLPILDGLDEVPESARRSAVRALDRSMGDGRGIVLTCRSQEYEDVIVGGAPVLRRAPVVEVEPVPAQDAIAYLADVVWPAATDWGPVHEHLRAEPDSALSRALSTPLMLSLARTVYQRCGRNPVELLSFGSLHAVEDHLTDHVIPAAYAPGPDDPEQQADGPDWRQEAERAERWLTYLAKYLHRHRERDLAWWLMSHRLLSRWAGPLIGIGAGTLVMTTVLLLLPALDTRSEFDSESLGIGAGIGCGFAVLAVIIWYAAPARPPGRLSFAVRGSLGRLRRGFATGLALSAIPLIPVLVFGAAAVSVTRSWSAADIADYFMAVTASAALATVVGLAIAVHNWLDAPPERSMGASPLGFLEQDRRSSLLGASSAGAVLGLTGGPLLVVGLSAGFLVLMAITGWSHEPSLADVVAFRAGARGPDLTDPLMIGSVVLLPGMAFALLTLLTRAWPRFLLVRLVLAVHGQMPWRMMRFLADARKRQLLRQHGGSYQFRHIRLQERLASRSLAEDRSPTAMVEAARRRRRIWGTGLVTVLLTAWLTLAHALPQDSSGATLVGHVDAMAFSPDGTVLATVGQGGIRRWKTATAKEIGAPQTIDADGLDADVLDLVLTSNTTAVTAEYRETPRELVVREWDLATGSAVDSTVMWNSTAFGYDRVVLNRDGTRLVESTISTSELRMFDTATGEEVDMRVGLGRPAAARNANGDCVAITDYDDRGWVIDVDTGLPVAGPLPEVAAVSGDGARYVTVSDHRAQMWNTTTGARMGDPLTGHIADIDSLALNADGSLLATTDEDDITRLWSIPTP